MEFNLSLSTTVADIIKYFQGNGENISGETEQGIFDNVLEGIFEDGDKSEDIDYNLILNLLNNLKLFNNEESLQHADKVSINLDKMESSDNICSNVNETEPNIISNSNQINTSLLSSQELEVLKDLNSKFEIVNNETIGIELNDKEIEVLKKIENIMPNNKIENDSEIPQINKLSDVKVENSENSINRNNDKIVNSEKFSQLETSNTTDKLNLIRNNELDEEKDKDKELNTLENILNGDNDNNFILNHNQVINKDSNSINVTSRQEVPIIRQEYIGEDIIKTVKYLKASGQEEITIKISPRELGDMTIKLINNHEEASVAIVISKSDVFNLINENQSEIAKHLKDLNINVKEITVEMKGNTQNSFSSNLNQEFERNNQRNQQGRKKNISFVDEPTEEIEEVTMEDNVNILI
ncbi:flagellar hook-length control protein FliK [Terrisporobacter petrolearius]|uniref:flagellar hook-length control protein FliK n=1 Tax=Terrisporobacter petrolearius TaxID=1460447 RepID=UPI0031CC3D6E